MLANLADRDGFVRHCLDLTDLPAVPPYWRRMRRQNAEGPALVGVLAEPPALPPDLLDRRQIEGAYVLDCRSPEAFGGGHVPGALNVELGSAFATWAGTVLPEGVRVLLVLEQARDLWEACWQLLRIGYDLPLGWLAGGMHAWRTAAKPLETLPQWTVGALREQLQRGGDLFLLDVRQPDEWADGHIEGAVHITGAGLPDRLGEVPRDRPIATLCGSGFRSSVAASLLAGRGYRNVVNVLGGMSAWQAAGYPVRGAQRPRNETARRH